MWKEKFSKCILNSQFTINKTQNLRDGCIFSQLKWNLFLNYLSGIKVPALPRNNDVYVINSVQIVWPANFWTKNTHHQKVEHKRSLGLRSSWKPLSQTDLITCRTLKNSIIFCGASIRYIISIMLNDLKVSCKDSLGDLSACLKVK